VRLRSRRRPQHHTLELPRTKDLLTANFNGTDHALHYTADLRLCDRRGPCVIASTHARLAAFPLRDTGDDPGTHGSQALLEGAVRPPNLC
jgi:hypothetical protein